MDPRRDWLGQRSYHELTGENICPSMIRGIDYVRDPRLNKVLKKYFQVFLIFIQSLANIILFYYYLQGMA